MLNLRKANQNVLNIASNGDMTFSGLYREGITNPPLAGELQFRKGAAIQATSTQAGSTRTVESKGRFFDNAVFPGQGLQLRNATGVQAEFDAEGDLYVRGRVTNALGNPATPGPFTVKHPLPLLYRVRLFPHVNDPRSDSSPVELSR